jgi:hypothetical protein
MYVVPICLRECTPSVLKYTEIYEYTYPDTYIYIAGISYIYFGTKVYVCYHGIGESTNKKDMCMCNHGGFNSTFTCIMRFTLYGSYICPIFYDFRASANDVNC